VSAIDAYKQAKQQLHDLEHSCCGRLSVRVERGRIQPATSELSIGFTAHEDGEIYKAVWALLRQRVEALRSDAADEARTTLEEIGEASR